MVMPTVHRENHHPVRWLKWNTAWNGIAVVVFILFPNFLRQLHDEEGDQ
jgi:hypothetical protein